MKINYKKKIGILGGSFDPAHIGHLKISIEAKKKFKINKIIWAVTKSNPLKSKSHFSLKKRITFAKKIAKKYSFISVEYYEDKIKSYFFVIFFAKVILFFSSKKLFDLKGFFLVIAQNILSILNFFFDSIEILICPL